MNIVLIMDNPEMDRGFLQYLSALKGQTVFVWDYLRIAAACQTELPAQFQYRQEISGSLLQADTLFLSDSIENKQELLQAFIGEARIAEREELSAYNILLPLSAKRLSLVCGPDMAQLARQLFAGCYEEMGICPERAAFFRHTVGECLLPDKNFDSLPEVFAAFSQAEDRGILLLEVFAAYHDKAAVQLHFQSPRLKAIHELLDLRARLQNGRKTILYLIHADFHPAAQNNVGGTQYHLRDLVEYFQYHCNILVVAKDAGGLRITLYQDGSSISMRWLLQDDAVGRRFYSAELAGIYGFLLDFFPVQLMHVHHTIDLSLAAYAEAAKRKVPICLTIHDFYYICPRTKLLCNRQEPATEECNDCLRQLFSIPEGRDYIQEWQEESRRILAMTTCIFAPSRAAGDIFAAFFPEAAPRLHVIEHGVRMVPPVISRESLPDEKEDAGKKRFRVAFIGGLTKEKGSQLILDILQQPMPDIEWHIFGGIDDPELFRHEQANLIKHGWYDQNKIVPLLRENQIDLVCILSIWQETYCYTLTEAWMAGLPVLAPDLGALGERIRATGGGWLLGRTMTVGHICQQIGQLQDNPAEYQAAREKIAGFRFKTCREMDKEYERVYFSLMQVPPLTGKPTGQLLWQVASGLAQRPEAFSGMETDGGSQAAANGNEAALRAEMQKIVTTRSWQWLLRLRRWRERLRHLF